MGDLPAGTVAFLFSEIEGGAALWERDLLAMSAAVERHLALLDAAIAAHGGARFKTVGEGNQAAFPTAPAAVAAAIEAQRAIEAEPWTGIEPLRVRMAVHVGEATPRDGDYLAPALNRLARLLGAAHGGQILLSAAAEALARGALPPLTSLRDLGVHRLRDLLEAERVFQVLHPDLPAEFPPIRSLDARLNNLPVQPNPLIGRERELTEVVNLLRDGRVRLLTLLGAGGTGKTRLALQAGAELSERFADGVTFVSLAAINDAALVPAAIASELNIREGAEQTPREQLLATLADKQMLLLLDNLEQIPDVATLVAELLAAAPGLSVLATSRTPLDLRGEREYAVLPLPLPPRNLSLAVDIAHFDAVRLFVERARAIRPEFALDDGNAPAVAEIVRRLDGLPLAIELAAARIRLFTPASMLTRLEKRLSLLTGGARDLPARQRALRETIAWSYDLLTPEEGALFRRLAIFAGGFTLDATEAISYQLSAISSQNDGENAASSSDPSPVTHHPSPSSNTLDLLTALVEDSLVQAVDAASGHARFRMLETIREFGRERLDESGETSAVRERHGQYFLDVAEAAARESEQPGADASLDRLEIEHDNLRAAMSWAIDLPDGAAALRLAAALWNFWEVRGHFTEGRAWLERVLARDAPGPPATLAEVLHGAGSIARFQGDADRASELLERSLSIWQKIGDQRSAAFVLIALGHVAERRGDLAGAGTRFARALKIGREIADAALTGVALNNLGIVADQQGEFAAAAEHYDKALAIFRRLGDRRRESIALDNLGTVARAQGDLASARHHYEAAIAVSRELGDAWGVAGTLGNLGLVAQQMGDLDRAREHFVESLQGFRELGDRRGVAVALDNLGLVARAQGDFPGAAALHGEGLALSQDLGDQIGVAYGIEGIAAAANDSGETEQMLRLFGAASALRTTLDAPLPPENSQRWDQELSAARVALGDARFAAALEAGRTLAVTDAVSEALAYLRGIGTLQARDIGAGA